MNTKKIRIHQTAEEFVLDVLPEIIDEYRKVCNKYGQFMDVDAMIRNITNAICSDGCTLNPYLKKLSEKTEEERIMFVRNIFEKYIRGGYKNN